MSLPGPGSSGLKRECSGAGRQRRRQVFLDRERRPGPVAREIDDAEPAGRQGPLDPIAVQDVARGQWLVRLVRHWYGRPSDIISSPIVGTRLPFCKGDIPQMTVASMTGFAAAVL